MPNVLVHTADESVTLSAQAVRRLLVVRALVGRLRDGLRRSDEPQGPEGLLRRFNAAALPAELSRQGPGRHGAVVPQQGQI